MKMLSVQLVCSRQEEDSDAMLGNVIHLVGVHHHGWNRLGRGERDATFGDVWGGFLHHSDAVGDGAHRHTEGATCRVTKHINHCYFIVHTQSARNKRLLSTMQPAQ